MKGEVKEARVKERETLKNEKNTPFSVRRTVFSLEAKRQKRRVYVDPKLKRKTQKREKHKKKKWGA